MFLYEQDLPKRKVAVKALIESVVDAKVRDRFIAEANAMALLSAHPSIVTIYFAGVAPDGRPCIVMEYCPRPNLSVRYRRETIPVAEALRIGVRVASAVETAHRAGILHRDIKPANVLVTEYGWPALTDFGISAQIDTVGEAEGLSIPWSAPELLGESPFSDVRTDVYALGACVYALLSGRSPFEQPGGANSAAALIARIDRDPVPHTGRRDVVPLLEQVLARSMHKRAEARYRSAFEFARALTEVEQAQGLSPTQIDVMDSVASSARAAEEDDSTRMRSVVTIDDDTQPRQRTTDPSSRVTTAGTAPEHEPISRSRLIAGLALVLVLIGIVVVVVVWHPTRGTPKPPPATGQTVVAPPPPAPPRDLACTKTAGSLTCTWKAAEGTTGSPKDKVFYQWNFTTRPGDRFTVDKTTFTAKIPSGVDACVEVRTVSSGRGSDAATDCA